MNQSKAYPFSKLIKALPLIIVLIGTIARLNVWVHNRSFFIDEANLARNIVEKSFPDYFDSLDYEQYAPPLFLMETKIVTAILGTRDYSFRIIPLISGIASLIILFLLLRDWEEKSIATIYALGLLSFSIMAIRYSTEFKQYSSDALLTLLLIWFAWKDRLKPLEWRTVVFWIIFGGLTIWYSMPAVFVLSGVGLFLLRNKGKEYFGRWLLMVGSWVLSFGLYYFLVLSQDVFDSNLQHHHSNYFMQLFTISGSEWKNNVELLVLLFKCITDKTAVPVVFGVLIFITGIIDLLRTDRSLMFLLLTPLLTVVFASSQQLYSFIPRMTLFILPLMMLVMAKGVSFLWSLDSLVLKLILVSLVSLSIINKDGYKHLYTELKGENIKSCFNTLQKEIMPDDKIYVHHEAVPAFEYYNNLSDRPFNLSNVEYAKWDISYHSFFSSAKSNSVYWLVFCHATSDTVLKTLNSIDVIGTSELYFEGTAASVYKFRLK